MKAHEFITEKWSEKYKRSINCSHPKGFSQRAHCAGKKKHNESVEMEMVCEACGMCQTHGNVMEIKKGDKDSNGYTKCWSGYHADGTKKGKNGPVRKCVPNESVAEAIGKKDLISRLQKDLPAVTDPKNKNADPVNWTGPGKDDYGYTGYQGHGMPTDRAERARIRADKKKGVAEELSEEFDLIESVIEDLAKHNAVDSEVIWEDLETLTDDELYVFATTTTIMETEAWQKANKKDHTAGMSQKAVNSYRREHPGSKLQTAVTTKPSKLKKGSKASKRRKSYCSRSKGQMNMHNISCAKTPDKAICKARRRWNC